MSAVQVKIIAAGVLFLLVFLSGYWLHHLGRPVNPLILTAHKLIALAAGGILAYAMVEVNRITPLGTFDLAGCILAAAFFIGTIATGGLVSVEKTMPVYVVRLHQVMPFLTVLSTALIVYRVLRLNGDLPML